MFKYKSNSELYIDKYDNNGVWTGVTTKIEKNSVWIMNEKESLNGYVKFIQEVDEKFDSIEIKIDIDILTEYFTLVR